MHGEINNLLFSNSDNSTNHQRDSVVPDAFEQLWGEGKQIEGGREEEKGGGG